MLIHHRGLIQDRFDTPFGVGTLIWAKDCHHNCPGCFHIDRHTREIYEDSSDKIIYEILSNPFNQGIILGGFEWTEQYDELIELIEKARNVNLEVILYTHYTIEEISTDYNELLNYKDMYIKCGEYDNTQFSSIYTSYGVPLASINQKIYKIGEEI